MLVHISPVIGVANGIPHKRIIHDLHFVSVLVQSLHLHGNQMKAMMMSKSHMYIHFRVTAGSHSQE